MYCYDVGIIDFFDGTYSLQSYINKLLDTDNEDIGSAGSAGRDLKELKESVLSAIKFLYNTNSFWEGDIRSSDNLRVGGLPASEMGCAMEYYFIFKQDNNGSTFVVSPYPLVWLENKLPYVNTIRDMNRWRALTEINNRILSYFDWGVNDQTNYKTHLVNTINLITKAMYDLERIIESLPLESEEATTAFQKQHKKWADFLDETQARLVKLDD